MVEFYKMRDLSTGCLVNCVASLLGVHPDGLPQTGSFPVLNEQLKRRGLALVPVTPDILHFFPEMIIIAGGLSPFCSTVAHFVLQTVSGMRIFDPLPLEQLTQEQKIIYEQIWKPNIFIIIAKYEKSKGVN